MRRVAGRFGRAGLEQVVEAGARVPPVGRNAVGGWQDRIEHDASNTCGKVAHDRLREVRAIGGSVDIPRGIAERLTKVGHVSSTFGRIVRAQIGTGCGQLAVTSFRCSQVGALRRFRIKAETETHSGEVVDRRAGKRRLREHGPALAQHQDVPVANKVGSDQTVDLERGDVARPTGEIDNGIGSLLR